MLRNLVFPTAAASAFLTIICGEIVTVQNLNNTGILMPLFAQAAGASGSDIINRILLLLVVILCICIYFIPFAIALARGHAYKWVIFGLNFFGFTAFLWIVAFVWAVWPSEKSLIDPLAGNVTGTGRRNIGDTIGSVDYGRSRGFGNEKGPVLQLSFVDPVLNKLVIPAQICDGVISIGRSSSCIIVIPSRYNSISSLHATIQSKGSTCEIIDGDGTKASANGLFIEGIRKVSGTWHSLMPGMTVFLGSPSSPNSIAIKIDCR